MPQSGPCCEIEAAVTGAAAHEAGLLARLRQGDEGAFEELVGGIQPSLLRLARLLLRDPGAAEEATQETWLAVLHGLDRFEGRSTLKTWVTRILINRARTIRARRGRQAGFLESPATAAGSTDDPFAPSRFLPADHPSAPHHWALPPSSWSITPERALLSDELRVRLEEAIARLPPLQREVITMRDVEGFSAREACNVLGLSESNQRVLLHRARTRLRAVLGELLVRGGRQ